MKKGKKHFKINWLLVAILALLIVLPGSIFLKLVSEEINPYLVTTLRYAMVGVITLPFIIKAFKDHGKLMLKKMPIILVVTLLTCASGPFHAAAIAYSSVSFVEIMNLSAPIVFAIVSILITRDKISKYATTGLLFAVLGGIVIVIIPLLLGDGAITVFGWQPVVLQGIVIVQAAFIPVFLRKMNEEGLPITALLGISFIGAFLISIPLAIFDGGPAVFSEISNLSIWGWIMIIYMAVIISILSRVVRTKAYMHIGTASYASLEYLYYFLAIISPLLLLGESLSWELVVGAILIIIGIIFTRKHSTKKSHMTHKSKTNKSKPIKYTKRNKIK